MFKYVNVSAGYTAPQWQGILQNKRVGISVDVTAYVRNGATAV